MFGLRMPRILISGRGHIDSRKVARRAAALARFGDNPVYNNYSSSPTLSLKEVRMTSAQELIGQYCSSIQLGWPHLSLPSQHIIFSIIL